jgi:hypothetical protein
VYIHARSLALAACAWLATACTGTISPGGGDDGGGPGGGGNGVVEAPRFARLTHEQWENTVQDLLRLRERPGLADQLQPDPPLGRFDNNVDRLTVTGAHWQSYQRVAETLGERVAGDGAVLADLTADLPADAASAARTFVERFGARAFRRPLQAAERDRYVALFTSAVEHYPDLDARTAGVRLVVEAMLQSPFFLYRTETAESDGATVALSGHEVASRLSYALWNTMPDDALFAAAAGGELETDAGVKAQAERLFDDPRARDQLGRFHVQLFSLAEYTDLDKDSGAFPEWNDALGAAMQEEAIRFLASVAFGDGGIREFLTSTKAFVNADLAEIYGVSGDFGDQLVEVDLDPTRRAGFLTRAGFLARNATLTEPDPIHRGVFINLDLLCRPIAAVPNLPDDLSPVGATNRERIDSITGEGTCGEGCHATMINPLGFALENYDAIGRYRTEDGGRPVDAAAAYTFADGRTIEFTDALDLSRQLADAPEVHACYAQHLLEYLYGRSLGRTDQALVDELAAASLSSDVSVRELVVSIVTSRAFRVRPTR